MYPPAFDAASSGVPVGILHYIAIMFVMEKLEWYGYLKVKKV